MTEEIRAFIAIELSPEIVAALSALQDTFRPNDHPYVKWVDPHGVHLTLKFLGNVRRTQIRDIEDAMSRASKGVAPFRLELGDLGAFPNLGRPRVLWVAMSGDLEPLTALQEGIEQSLVPLGFAREGRAFTPHLTLGRLRERAAPEERRRIGQLVRSADPPAPKAMQAQEVSLMRSTLTPHGAQYSRLASIRLTGRLSTPDV